MAIDQEVSLFEVTLSVRAKPTDYVQAEDPQAAEELVEERASVVIGDEEIEGAVTVESVSEVAARGD